jgi:formate-dependent nitrite reductase membrane component NrfD
MLKPSVWKWEIAGYFFLGGLSAGAYILARLSERFGGGRCRDLAKTGAAVSFVTMLPCAPLLIHDLGDSKRFHHMLRVWKPTTPMNLGTWTLIAYSGMVSTEALRMYLRERAGGHRRGALSRRIRSVLEGIHDAAGIPFAVLIAGYTGVLLSCTANPMWSRNRWIGPLFSAGALANGAEAASIALLLQGLSPESPSVRALSTIDSMAHAAEGITAAGYLREAGEMARPVTHGSVKRQLLFAAGGLVAAEVIKHLPLRRRAKKVAAITAGLIGLAAGLSMRWAMVYGGREASADPHLDRVASRPRAEKHGGQ